MLYNITAELTNLNLEISQVLEDEYLSSEEKDSKTEIIFQQYLSVESKFDDRACQMAAYVKQLEAEAFAIKSESERIALFAKEKSKLAAQIKATLLEEMQCLAKTKIEGSHAKISIRKNPTAVVVDADIEEIPEDLVTVKVTKTPDKKAIKAFVQANPDCDFAHIEQTSSLTIK